LPKGFSTGWKVDGRMYFEEMDGDGFSGTVTLSRQVRKGLKNVLNVQTDNAGDGGQLTVLKRDGIIVIENRKGDGDLGSTLYATVLRANPLAADGHETLHDVYAMLPLEGHFSAKNPPKREQIAKAYCQLVKPGWLFSISDVVLQEGNADATVVAMLSRDGNCEIKNGNGDPVSASISVELAYIDPSFGADRSWMPALVDLLQKKLRGKNLKVSAANGEADLRFSPFQAETAK
jgi:hypothetical protein